MNAFDPRTYSTDWEIMVVDKLERCVGTEKLLGFSGDLKMALDLPIQVDWNALECALGINSSFDQLWERVRRVTDRVSQFMREYDLDVFPTGSHPVEAMHCSSHIHVGTIHDEAACIYVERAMMRYCPAFAALAANSPASHGMRDDFKSYRVAKLANWATRPSECRDPQFAQPGWGTDACPKVYGAPTMEIRITDCASSRRFLAELATFVAAYVHHKGTEIDTDYEPSPQEYRDYLTNRWSAAKYGLQASFCLDGKCRPVVDVLDEMLDECSAELEALGVKRSSLALIEEMLRKRTCQADLVAGLMDRYPDKHILASVLRKLIRTWNAFDEYLETAPVLEPVDALDEDAILAHHLSFVGEGTHFYHLRQVMCYPAPAADELIESMIARNLITREVVPNRGMVLSRVERS